MSFATDAKSEIMRAPCEQESAVRCEMNAAFLLAGSISFKGAGRYLLSMSSESAAVARYCFTQVRRLSEIKPEIQTVRSSQLGDHTRYRLELSESDSALVLDKLGLLDPAAFLGIRREPPTLDGETERVAWLRGAFLATGWVAAPEKAYNVEFALSGEDHAEYTARLLNGMGIRAGVSPRKSQTVVYVKDFEGVSRLLALMGAANIRGEGCVRVGDVEAGTTFGALCARVQRKLHAVVRAYGAADTPVSRLGCCSGAGGSLFPEAAAMGADCFVTGEIKHHVALEAMDAGVCVIEAGHFETENPACEVMANALQNACDALKYNVTVFCSKGNPFGR